MIRRTQALHHFDVAFEVDQRPVRTVHQFAVVGEIGDPGADMVEIAPVVFEELSRRELPNRQPGEVDEDVRVLRRHLGGVDDPRIAVVRHHETHPGKLHSDLIHRQRMGVFEDAVRRGGVAGVDHHRHVVLLRQLVERVVDRVREITAVVTGIELDADALLLLTEWKCFRMPSWGVIKREMKEPLVIDGRNIYDITEMEEAGFKYYSIGR